MKKPKHKGAATRPPKTWEVLISTDSKTGKFTYLDSKKNDLQRLFPINGDSIRWTLHTPIKKQPFQVSFSEVNPFNVGSQIFYRGNGTALSDKVQFPENFVGSKLCKYTVTLSNGWSDDPDVVPLPADAGLHPFDAANGAVCLIQWVVKDGVITGITLSPSPTDLTSSAHQPVDWKWAEGQPHDTMDFTLTFDTPVPDCPQTNDSAAREIVLTPGKVAQTGFTVAVTIAGTPNPYTASGTLTVG